MKESVLATRYALAIIGLSKKDGAVSPVRESLNKFLGIILERRDFLLWLADEEIKLSKRECALREVAGAIKMHILSMNFLMVILRSDRIKHISHIIRIVNDLADEAEGIVRGSVLAINKSVSEKIAPTLEKILSKKLNKNVFLSAKGDPSIVGGVILQLKDHVWDASIKRSLKEIEEQLCQ